jgi:subtilisin family serine protease
VVQHLTHWPDETGIKVARAQGFTGTGIRVGVLDTGIDADHEQFATSAIQFMYVPHPQCDSHLVVDVRGFDTQGHGSHVSGIIAGASCGIAPDVELSVAAVCESETQRSGLIRFGRGLKWVIELFRDGSPSVLNLSLGYFPPPTPIMSEAQWENWISVLRRTLRQLEQANVLVVASWTPTYQLPAELQEVIAVGAVNSSLRRIDRGHYLTRQPDLMGFGDATSAAGRDQSGRSIYTELSGASQAAAYVTGIAALWRQAFPQLDVRETRAMLLRNALPLAADDMLEAGLARYVRLPNPN